MQWNKTNCPYLKTQVRQVQTQEQTQELRLPEDLPDIGRVLGAWGQPMLRGKDWRADTMTASGGVTATVLYQPEGDGGPQSVDVWIPFQLKWSFPQAQREGTMRVLPALRSLDARILSARKMMVRSTVALLGEALEPTETQVFTPEEIPDGVEVLTNVYPAVLPREAGEKQFTFEDEIRVPNVKKWLSFDIFPDAAEQNVVASRAVIRGSAQAHYLYMDEGGAVRSGRQEIPFAQFAELDREYNDQAQLDVMCAVSSLETETTPEGVRLQCTLAAQYVVWDTKLLEIAQDAYSPHCELALEKQILSLPMALDQRVEALELRPEVPDGRVIDMTFLADHPGQLREGEEVHLEAGGTFHILYRDSQGDLQTATEACTQTIPLSAAADVQICGAVMSLSADPARGVRMKVGLRSVSEQQIPMLTALTQGEAHRADEARPTLILRRMDADSLWELAKASGSTVDAIRKANRLTADPHQGQMLLIPIS